MILILIGIGVVILLIWWFLWKRKECVPPATCLVDGDCCDGLHCISGKCQQPLPQIQLYPSFSTGEIGVDNSNVLQNVNGILTSGSSANNFATWDGMNKLSFSTLVEDANGHSTVTTMYLAEPIPGLAPRVSQTPGNILITQEGKILSANQQYGLSLQVPSGRNQSGGFVWAPASQAFIFHMNVCPSEQTCSTDNDCCGPVKKCNGGKCQKCFGDMDKISSQCCDNPPCAQIGNDYTIQCDANNNLQCTSRCGPEISCPPNAKSSCVKNDQDQWERKCVSKCSGDPPKDCAKFDCRDDGTGNYAYYCLDAECHPDQYTSANCGTKQCDSSGLNCTYSLNGQSVIPQYDCGWKKWKCSSTCPADACKNQQCPAGQYPKCDDTTNFSCTCVSDNQPDFCGSIPKPPHDDAVCRYVDETNCGGPSAGWRWYVEDEITDNCQLAAFHAAEGWKEVACTDEQGDARQIMLINGVPIFPTVDANNCRGVNASAVSPDPNIHNPAGHIVGQNTSNCRFIPYDPSKHHYYASPAVKQAPYCLIDDTAICHGGEFVSNQNPTLVDIPSAGSAPTPNEVLSANIGHCNCAAHTSGLSCEYNAQTCSGNGDPIPVAGNPDAYTCSCQPGFYGANCSYTVQDCNNNGTPQNLSKLQCDCKAGFSGSKCQYTRQICNYQGSPDDNGVCACDPMFAGQDCLNCISPTAPIALGANIPNTFFLKAFGYDNLVVVPKLSSLLGKPIWMWTVAPPCAQAVGKVLYDVVKNDFQLEFMGNFYAYSQTIGSPLLKVQQADDTSSDLGYNFRANKCGFLQDMNGNYYFLENPYGGVTPPIQPGVTFLVLPGQQQPPVNITGMLYLSPVTTYPSNDC